MSYAGKPPSVGDVIEVRIYRLLTFGIRDGFTTREEWIPAVVRNVDDSSFMATVYAGHSTDLHAFPIDSSDWRQSNAE